MRNTMLLLPTTRSIVKIYSNRRVSQTENFDYFQLARMPLNHRIILIRNKK